MRTRLNSVSLTFALVMVMLEKPCIKSCARLASASEVLLNEPTCKYCALVFDVVFSGAGVALAIVCA